VLLVCTVYSELALSRKPFGIGHMYIYNFLLRMTDTVTSQNIDLSSWDILYPKLRPWFLTLWAATYPIWIRQVLSNYSEYR
jgi:hypothetical protein